MTLKQDERIRERYKDECLAAEKGEVCEFKLHHDGPHSWQLPLKYSEPYIIGSELATSKTDPQGRFTTPKKSNISQFVSGLQIEDEFEEF